MAFRKISALVGSSLYVFAITSLPAAAMPDAARQETVRLINSIGTSGCEFERNGSWYKASEAVAHLTQKLNATESRLQTTEQFITYVASTSSVSGKPYHLRCNGAQEEAKPWLEKKLAGLRGK